MIVDMQANKELSPIAIELFLRGRKLKVSIVFMSKPISIYTIRLNATHYFIMKILNKKELHQVLSNQLSDI